jgi:hypothetical protein
MSGSSIRPRCADLIPLLLAVATALPLTAHADLGQQTGASDASLLGRECRSSLAFAYSLEEQHEYYRAVTELMRCRFLCGAPVRSECELGIARCLLRAGAYRDLAEWGESRGESGESEVGARLRFLAGVGRYELGCYTDASEDFRKAYMWGKDSVLAGPSALNWGLALARDRRFDRARTALNLAADDPLVAGDLQACRQCVDAAAAFRPRSRSVAGALAVVPGLGYAYSGHWQTALVTAAILGLSGWGLAETVEDESYGTATVLGFFALTWYSGSICGSRQAAVRYNEAQLNRLLEPAELLCPPWATELEDSALDR